MITDCFLVSKSPILAASEEIKAIEAEIEAELQEELEPPKEKRWIAFAPTSYHQCKTHICQPSIFFM